MATQNSLAQPVRPRNARATRAAILDAARACFTQRAYEHVGVRDIAKRAGVNGALVIRYFGSKRQLFSAAMTGRFAFDHIVGGRPPDSKRIVRMVLKSRRSGRVDAVLAVVRSAADPEAGAILKKNLEEEFIKPFAAALPGTESLQRAALITAYLLGLAIARDVLRINALAHSADRLMALVAPVIQSYIDDCGLRSRGSATRDRNHKCGGRPLTRL